MSRCPGGPWNKRARASANYERDENNDRGLRCIDTYLDGVSGLETTPYEDGTERDYIAVKARHRDKVTYYTEHKQPDWAMFHFNGTLQA